MKIICLLGFLYKLKFLLLMLLSQLISFLENRIAPKAFAMKNDVYGIQFGQTLEDRNIKKVMITLDPSLDAIIEASKQKVSLLLSYYGLIHRPTLYFHDNLVKKFRLLSISRIILYVLHSAFEAAQNGISEILANKLFLKIEDLFYFKNKFGNQAPLGRICVPEKILGKERPLILNKLIERIKKTLDLKYIRYIGELNKEIKKICIMGSVSTESLLNAVEAGCDCYLTRQLNYDDALLARDLDIVLIETSHFESEIIGMNELHKILSIEFPRDPFILYNSNDPFSYDF